MAVNRAFQRGRKLDAARLSRFFHNGGCVRRQDPMRLKDAGYKSYKKGDEARLMADSYEELEAIRESLEAAGFVPGAPFRKGNRFCQPLYGREAVARFLALIDKAPRK
jgi:hypothetical protein